MYKRKRYFWSVEELKKAAKPFKKRVDFMRKEPGAYQSAYKKGVIDEVCAHMHSGRKKNKFVVTYANLALVVAPVFKYKTLKAFRENNRDAYSAGNRLGIAYEELFENKDNPKYLQELITKLAEDSATFSLGKNRELKPHLR